MKKNVLFFVNYKLIKERLVNFYKININIKDYDYASFKTSLLS